MRKCKKCLNEISEDDKNKICKECKQKERRRNKKIYLWTGISILILAYFDFILKKRTDEDSLLEEDDDSSDLYEHTDLSDNLSSSTRNISEFDFENIINGVAKEMPKIKSFDIRESVVDVTFNSNSKKQTWGASFNFDDDGEITGNYKCHHPNGSYATSKELRFFGEKVCDKINEVRDNEL